MSDLYPNIDAFCRHWSNAAMLQHTYEALEREFKAGNDGCIDAAKSILECACKTLVEELDDPINPIRERPDSPVKSDNPSLGNWLTAAIRLLNLVDDRTDPLNKVISQYNTLTVELGNFRKKAGPLSHGKLGFVNRLSEHHRRMAIIAADTVIGFLHDAYLDQQTDPVRTFEPYERFGVFNEKIDAYIGFAGARIEDGRLIVGIELEEFDTRRIDVSVSQLLFGVERQTYKEALRRTAALPLPEPEEEAVDD
jgi:hypothetical protein